uniref:Putative salivary kunitz domain protein n=1 Tax=Ixodes ricinus TaxID=34613 RepID=A0A0K8RK10_IXORI
MKAVIAVICIFSAVLLISALDRDICEAPHAISSCAPSAEVKASYYFDNRTQQCEEEVGCGKGPNNFPTLEKCKKGCPYGEF